MPAVGSPASLMDKHRTSYLGLCLHYSSHGKSVAIQEVKGKTKKPQEGDGKTTVENEISEILHRKLSRRQTNTNTCAHLYPRNPQAFFTTKPRNILFHQQLLIFLRDLTPPLHPSLGCRMSWGLCSQKHLVMEEMALELLERKRGEREAKKPHVPA